MAEQDITMKFESGGDMLPFLKELRDNVNKLNQDSTRAQDAIQADFRKTADAVKQTNTEFAASSKLVVAIAASAQQGLPALIKNLAQVGDVAEGLAESLSEADRANFKSVNDALRDVLKNEGLIVSELDKEKKARIDVLETTKKITAEDAKLLREVTAVVDTVKQLDNRKPAKLIDTGSAQGVSAPAASIAIPDDALENARKLRAEYTAAAAEAARIGQTFGKDSTLYAQAVANATKLKQEVAASVAPTSALQQRFKAVSDEAKRVGQTLGTTSREFRVISQEAAQIKKEIDASTTSLQTQEQAAQTVKARIRELKEEAAQAALAGDEITYKRAAQEAGALQETLKDTAASINAFNPDDKAGAFGRMFGVIGNGVQAVGGLAIAFGVQDQAIEKAFFRLQSFVTGFQGAAAFIKDFGDTYRDFLRVLGLSTAETVKSTVASEVDTVTKTGQAAATTELGVATTAANTATKGLWATFAASPLGPLLLILGAVAGAMALLVGKTEEETKAYSDLVDEIDRGFDQRSTEIALNNAKKLREEQERLAVRLGEVAAGKRKDAELTAEEREEERKRNKEIDDATIAAINEQKRQRLAAIQELRAAFDQVITPQGDLIDGASAFAVSDLTKRLGIDADATAQQITDAYNRAAEDVNKFAASANADIASLQTTALADGNDRRQKELEDIKAKAKATLAIREQLAANIEAIEKTLAEKIRALEIGAADPRERLKLEREAGEEGITILEKNLRREIALQELRVKVGTEAFQALSEAQRKAAADAIIDEGGGQLSTKQAEAFAKARVLIEEETLRKMVDLQLEFDLAIAEASGDAQQKQLADLDALLVEREKKLRDAGATEIEIAEDAARQTAIVQKKLAQDRLALDEQTQLDLLGAQLAAADGRPELERTIQEKILSVKIEFAKKALELIVDNGKAENTAAIAAAKRNIAELEKELGNLKDNIEPLRLSDLFDLEGEEADRFNEAAKSIVDSAFDIVGQLNAADQLRVDQQIETTDQLIEDIQRRGDELQAQLEKDQEANAKGLANNLDATLKAIADNKAAEEKALADKKRLVAEKQKLAKQQAIADTIQQSSSLLTAATSIFKEGALVPGGIFVAIGIVASMVAAFLALKNKIAASTQPLWKGTKSVERKGAPAGIDTIPAMLTERERVVDVETSARHRTLYDGLQDKERSAVRKGLVETAKQYDLTDALADDVIPHLTPKQLERILERINIAPLLAEHRITVNERATREVVTMNNTHRERVERANATSMAGVESRLDALTKKLDSFQRQEGDREQVTVIPPKSTVIRKRKGHTAILEAP